MDDGVMEMTFEAEGKNAVESIISTLERFKEDSEFKHVKVQVSTKSGVRSDPNVDDGANIKQATIYGTTNPDKKDKKINKIRSGTSHETLLTTLAGLGDELPVTTKRLLDEVDIPEGTAYAAMSTLQERGLVARVGEDADGSSLYNVTVAGKEELQRIGGTE
ncbi:hypothetical protein [Halorubrum sp. DTA98]|uniref:hypothetical protein n=1 Tax=Halorubrum sp. DTA98 TaxID=3402163 RepID=UPI003AB0D19A